MLERLIRRCHFYVTVLAAGLMTLYYGAIAKAVELTIDPPVDMAAATADIKTGLVSPMKAVYSLLAGFLILTVIWLLISRGTKKHASKT